MAGPEVGVTSPIVLGRWTVMDVELVTQALTPPRVSTAQRVCFSFFIKICWDQRILYIFHKPYRPFSRNHCLFLWHNFFLYSNAYKEGFE